MQDIAKGYIFTLYPEHVAIVEEYADAEWRGNKSEALRRIIENFKQLSNERVSLPAGNGEPEAVA